jgi:CheY-like chemotaxis protein
MAKFNNVLLVEDDSITVMVCERIITMTGFAGKVKSAVNGKDALDYLQQLAETGEVFPEIIFLDINMPVMNGWQFLEEFEKVAKQYPTQPRVYILSSTVDPEDYKKAESFKTVTSFISKPLTKDHLETIPVE